VALEKPFSWRELLAHVLRLLTPAPTTIELRDDHADPLANRNRHPAARAPIRRRSRCA